MKFLLFSFPLLEKSERLCVRRTKKSKQKTQTGFALIEALVAVGILVVVLSSAIGALLVSAKVASGNGARLEAVFLSDEGVEVMRILRDTSWSSNIATHASGAAFYLSWNGSAWVATDTNTFIDNLFERSVVLTDAYRDGSEQISSSGTLDSNTKKVTVTVSWRADGATSTRTLSAYISNLFSN